MIYEENGVRYEGIRLNDEVDPTGKLRLAIYGLVAERDQLDRVIEELHTLLVSAMEEE